MIIHDACDVNLPVLLIIIHVHRWRVSSQAVIKVWFIRGCSRLCY